MSRISMHPSGRPRAAFSLIELLIVITILGILAAFVVPRYGAASDEALDSALASQLRRLRGQIEVYRTDHGTDPGLVANQWADLVGGGYIKAAPENPMNESTTVAGAPAAGVGWVWRDKGNGTFNIYATDAAGTAEYVE